MSRIDDIFRERRARGLKTLMPFVVGGRPAPGDLGPILLGLERGGASIVEIGFPFSDPIADGPVIAAAMHLALQAGVTPTGVLDAVSDVRGSTNLGLVAMVSISIVHRLGGATFIREARAAGVDGLILPDAPADEAELLIAAAREADLSVALLIAPTTPPDRAARIAEMCTGFVYLLARVGITGQGDPSGPPVAPDLRARMAELRSVTRLPIACGFGISTAAQVREVVAPDGRPELGADAAIVGSALVRLLEEHPGTAPFEAEQFCRKLAAGLV